MAETFRNDDGALAREAEKVLEERKALGLEGMTGELAGVVIMVEPENQAKAVGELLGSTGLDLAAGFKDELYRGAVLAREGSADFLVLSRLDGNNPFVPYNRGPKSDGLPNTRLETFVFECVDVHRYVTAQKKRGVQFVGGVRETDAFSFAQTMPSPYTGNSVGVIAFKGPRQWAGSGAKHVDWGLAKPDRPYLKNIFQLDHTATRVRAEHRDPAILEFMGLTDYAFAFAIHVESLNSITNVARRPGGVYAQVFTSGISPFVDLETSGPTERFIHNYNTRVHHMAFRTEEIESVCASLAADGMDYLAELVGSPEEGLKQAFTQPMPATMILNEYIHRYGDFDGFFTKSNVTFLTQATAKQ